jgi:Na+-transporting NADH:ubiquinone oxidoreductase subunit C
MVILSVVCALILSIVASILAKPQAEAKELDRSEQMMIAAKILSYGGYFLVKDDKEKYEPAKFTPGGVLVPGSKTDYATSHQILEIYNNRLIPFLVDHKGNLQSFKEANVDEQEYLSEFQKLGYYKLPLMLIYKILPNSKKGDKVDPEKSPAEGWVVPINGFGLWDAIYGYLAIDPNGDSVIGITWYQQKETPGLGANIATPEWQADFPGKLIFQENADGKTDFKTTELGINVVKGKVSEVLGNSPKAKSSVDGMSGATLTGNGVTAAYKDTLAPYRPFLIKIHDDSKKNKNKEAAS